MCKRPFYNYLIPYPSSGTKSKKYVLRTNTLPNQAIA